MHVAIYLPLLASLALGLLAPAAGRRLPPATAVRLLCGSAVVVAAAAVFACAMLAFALLGELPPVAALGHWSAAALDAADPVPDGAAGAAAVALGVVSAVTARSVRARAAALLSARRLCQGLGGEPGGLVVVDDDALDAYAVPGGRAGRIVVSRSLLRALPARERRAVLAHEAAHLADHHAAYRLVADLAGSVDPLLRPVVGAVHFATERWADEAAAGAVGDRRTVARAVARTALRRQGTDRTAPWGAAVLRASGNHVTDRVTALLAPPPRHRPVLLLVVAAVLVTAVGSGVEAQRDTERLFEHAQAVAGVQR